MANRFPRRRRDRPGKSPRTQSLFLERFGGERLEQRRVMDASAVALWEEAPAVLSETVSLDGGFTATANAQSGDFTFTTNNGEVTITGFTGSRVVEIPAKIEGLPVRAIGDFAFSGKLHQSSIEIPDSVTSIGRSAFADCISLTSVTIPASVTSIGRYPFYACKSLVVINVAADNAAYASVEGVLYDKVLSSLIQCPEGKAGPFVIPTGVTNISRGGFINCDLLTSIIIPETVTSTGDDAFAGCSGLNSINIPFGWTIVDEGVFSRCTGLTSVTIPDSVEILEDDAFSTCTSLASVNVPHSVVSIGWNTFAKCSNLKSIEIPESVVEMAPNAFSDCTQLRSVFFYGDTPNLFATVFSGTAATIYRLGTATSWSSNFDGLPVKVFQPVNVISGQKVVVSVESSSDRVVKKGLGTAVLAVPSNRTGGTVVEEGELVVRHKASLGAGLLEVQAGAKATLQTGYDTVSVTSLDLADTARLELGTGRLVISAGGFTESDIRAKLVAGRGGGTWSGASGITSSFAGGDRAIGYRVVNGSLQVAYAAPGDSNLDGVVDILDIADILSARKFNTGAAANWQQGDVNYDNVFDIVDLADILGTGLFNEGTYLTLGSTRSAAVETGGVATFDSALVFAALAMDSSGPTTTKRKSF